MRKAPLALAAAAVLGLTAVAAPSPAQAYWRGGGWGAALAGGLIAGAVIGGIASNAYAYGPGYGYVMARVTDTMAAMRRRITAGMEGIMAADTRRPTMADITAVLTPWFAIAA